MKKKPKIGICAICGSEAPLTKEHIPPKGIFLKPRPINTITIFTCEKCNQDTKLDDEYFRFWVAAVGEPDTKLGELWKKKVVGSSFERSPALLRKFQEDHLLLRKHHSVDALKTYDNKIVPEELLDRCYMVEAERINKVATKIVRGLYFHHYNQIIPSNVEFIVSDAPIDIQILRMIIMSRKGMVGGEEGEFIYWYKFADHSNFHSKWVLLFYLRNYLTVETNLRIA